MHNKVTEYHGIESNDYIDNLVAKFSQQHMLLFGVCMAVCHLSLPLISPRHSFVGHFSTVKILVVDYFSSSLLVLDTLSNLLFPPWPLLNLNKPIPSHHLKTLL